MNEIKVEDNVPIPARGKFTELVGKMQPGQSVVLSKEEASTFASAAAKAGKGVTTRPEGDGRRVWIVEKKATRTTRKPRKAKETATQTTS